MRKIVLLAGTAMFIGGFSMAAFADNCNNSNKYACERPSPLVMKADTHKEDVTEMRDITEDRDITEIQDVMKEFDKNHTGTSVDKKKDDAVEDATEKAKHPLSQQGYSDFEIVDVEVKKVGNNWQAKVTVKGFKSVKVGEVEVVIGTETVVIGSEEVVVGQITVVDRVYFTRGGDNGGLGNSGRRDRDSRR